MRISARILYGLLILFTIACMLLPIAYFEDISAELAQKDVTKQASRVSDAQNTLDRYVNRGEKQEKIDKQKGKVAKEQAKLDEAQAKLDALIGAATESGIGYSLLTGKLPQQLKFDQARIKEFGVYNPNVDQYYLCVYLAFGLTVLSLALFMLGRGRLVSKFFTFSSLANLAAILAIFYVLFRLKAFPVSAPISDARLTWLQYPLMICPVLALFVNITFMRNTKKAMIYIFCTFLSLLSLMPFWIMMVNATRASTDIQSGISLIPSHYLQNNIAVLNRQSFDVGVGFRNSAIIAFGSTILGVYFSALTAYGLTAYNFRGSKFLYAFILAIIMIPAQVTSTGFYMFMYQLELVNNYLPLILPAIAAPATVFFLKQYLHANFQVSLVEASRIDGAGEFFTFNRIVVPLMMPAIATMGIMAVITSWNNYLTPLMLLSNPNMKTLPMMVKELRGDIYRTEFGSIYLGLTMTALPLLVVYFALSKYIIRGVAVGGVKE